MTEVTHSPEPRAGGFNPSSVLILEWGQGSWGLRNAINNSVCGVNYLKKNNKYSSAPLNSQLELMKNLDHGKFSQQDSRYRE